MSDTIIDNSGGLGVPPESQDDFEALVMRAKVWRLIDRDRQYRGNGSTNNGDLYKLETLQHKTWNYPLPTLLYMMGRRQAPELKDFVAKNNYDLAQFVTNFYKMAPEMVGLDMTNVLVAGGCPGNVVRGQEHSNDVDLFIYGISSVIDANKKVDAIVEHLVNQRLNQMRLRWDDRDTVIISKAEHCVTVKFRAKSNMRQDCTQYQIILQLNSTVSEILHGFDMSCSAIGFDGSSVWLTGLGRLAFEYGIAFVNLDHSSYGLEKRIDKYMRRGFGFVFPYLSTTKATIRRGTKHIDLSCLRFELLENDDTKNCIFVKNMWCEDYNYSANDSLSFWDGYHGGWTDKDVIQHWNLICFARGYLNRLVYYKSMRLKDIVDAKNIVLTCDLAIDDDFVNSYYSVNFRKNIWNGKYLDFNKIQKYICGDASTMCATLFDIKSFEGQQDFLKQQCEKTALCALSFLKEGDLRKPSYVWCDKDSSGQLHHCPRNAVQFYGEYMNHD